MRNTDVFTLSKGRFEAFSDGVFAIAITLLTLEIHVPSQVPATAAPAEQLHALVHLWPQYLVYVATFATIGIMWLNHHALFKSVERVTHGMTVANLFLLAIISFFPFATEVLGVWRVSPVSVVYYGILSTLMSIAYTILRLQVSATSTRAHRRLTPWNFTGLTFYPVAAAVGYFLPLAGVALYAVIALWYMLPGNVRSGVVPQ